MPRIFYIPPDDFEPLPEWMDDSRVWKSRKVGGGSGESERLMKKGREKTRGSRHRKEMGRMKSYQESIKRKEKMVKEDRKRSEMTDGPKNTRIDAREAGKNGPKVAKKDIRDARKRWQLGDGFQLALRKGNPGKSKLERKNLSRRHRDSRKERVIIEVERVEGREKVKEWVDKFKTASTCVQGVSSESSLEDLRKNTDGNIDLFEIVSPWPISRYCMEDPNFQFTVQTHCYTSNPSGVHDLQPVNILYSLFSRPASAAETGDMCQHSHERNALGVKCQKNGSLRKRLTLVLCRLARFFRL
ncbi:uncharacterized protein [Haliotis asinina]|uniref:uncharacterized protein n=1 Tax=Haliotis asinina TaxID=109174 RepID=UPI0035327CA2